MIQIVQAIDDYTESHYGYLNLKNWGLCELSYKQAKDKDGRPSGTQQPIVMVAPSTRLNGDRGKQIALDDKFEFITWIRWVEPVRYEVSEEWSFGRNEAKQAALTLRVVVAHKTYLGESLIFQYARGFPNQFNETGFKFIFLDGRPVINPDHETIYRTELGDTAYEKHRFTWNIYTVDMIFNFIECLETTP